jgi:hypothetical protein
MREGRIKKEGSLVKQVEAVAVAGESKVCMSKKAHSK